MDHRPQTMDYWVMIGSGMFCPQIFTDDAGQMGERIVGFGIYSQIGKSGRDGRIGNEPAVAGGYAETSREI